MALRKEWQARKEESEEAFKKAHARELLDVHTHGLTPFPVKFELGLGPVLDSLESAQKNNKPADVQKYKTKAKDIVGKYKTRVTGKKTELGAAFDPLNRGITHLEAALR
jgi:hypothetical protein